MEGLWSFSSSVSEIEDTIYCTFSSAAPSELFLGGLSLPELLETMMRMMMMMIACIPERHADTSMAQSHFCSMVLDARARSLFGGRGLLELPAHVIFRGVVPMPSSPRGSGVLFGKSTTIRDTTADH